MSLSTYPEIKFSGVKYTASPSTIKAPRETTLSLITVQHRKKPSPTPDLDGQRASCNKAGKKKKNKTIMIADEVQTLWAAQEDPNHLTFLIKTQPNYPVLSVMREWGVKSRNKCGCNSFHLRGFLLWFYLHHEGLVLSQSTTGSSRYPQASHSFQEHNSFMLTAHSPACYKQEHKWRSKCWRKMEVNKE